MSEVSFDVIVATSTQTNNFTLRKHQCELHCYNSSLGSSSNLDVEELDGTLLKIYAKIIDLLDAAAITYTNSISSADVPNICRQGRTDTSNTTAFDSQAHSSPVTDSRVSPGVVCLPSKAMAVGKYELDVGQSASLALLLISRIAKISEALLQKMAKAYMWSQRKGDAGTGDERILKLLSRLTRLKAVLNISLEGVVVGRNNEGTAEQYSRC